MLCKEPAYGRFRMSDVYGEGRRYVAGTHIDRYVNTRRKRCLTHDLRIHVERCGPWDAPLRRRSLTICESSRPALAVARDDPLDRATQLLPTGLHGAVELRRERQHRPVRP